MTVETMDFEPTFEMMVKMGTWFDERAKKFAAELNKVRKVTNETKDSTRDKLIKTHVFLLVGSVLKTTAIEILGENRKDNTIGKMAGMLKNIYDNSKE